MNKKTLIKNCTLIFFIFHLFSCSVNSKNEYTDNNVIITPNDTSKLNKKNTPLQNNYSFLDTIKCDETKEEFQKFKINGLEIESITKSKWLNKFPKFDSIIDNYIYYGQSNIFIDKSGVVTFTISDDNIKMTPFGELGLNSIVLAKKYPCSFKKIDKNLEIYSFEIFDSKFNKLRYYISNDKVISISYFVEEEMPYE